VCFGSRLPKRINKRERVKKQETGENSVVNGSIGCILQQNGGWWNGKGWMCLAGHGSFVGGKT